MAWSRVGSVLVMMLLGGCANRSGTIVASEVSTASTIPEGPVRAEPADSGRFVRLSGFSGVWSTTYGAMRLVVEGDRVTGSYSYGGGATIDGRIVDGVLSLNYRESGGVEGRAVFQLDASADRFDGVWAEGREVGELSLEDAELSRWAGERVLADPKRRWLVILEVHWEESLTQTEFSYGAMLRAFFQRVPDIAVRHRFVHDRTDLVRFLEEVASLPEPAVVYVSSHGTKEGIQTPAGTVGGEAIGEALRLAGPIDLLHFGACSALDGDFAERIREASAPHPSFPISGYRRDADWAGSAIVDFAYLSLVLEHGMSPHEAVEEVRRSIEFAGDGARAEAAVAGVDLVIR